MIANYKNTKPSMGYANGSSKTSASTAKNLIQDFLDERRGTVVKIDRKHVIDAINKKDKEKCRLYSQTMYSRNPVYLRLIEYMSNILCFYWAVFPSFFMQMQGGMNNEEIQKQWMNVIFYLEKINPEILGKDILQKVLINGEIFFAVKEKASSKKVKSFGIQELPINYCRSIKKINNRDVVEINLDYFDTINKERLAAIMNSYPAFLVKMIQNRKACPKDPVTGGRWAIVDPDYAFHFSLKKDNLPFFIGVILDLLDLQDAKDINMFKMEQELSKVLALVFPLDSNDTPVFDDAEITAYHNDVVNLLKSVPGIEVISTMAEVKDIDFSNSSQSQSVDNVQRQYENVYNSAGVSQKIMAADNAGTLNISIVADSSILFNFLNDFSNFLSIQISNIFGENNFILHMPQVTVYNQKEKIDYYIKQSTYGYSKFLPAICMGQRQSMILSSVWFESQILQMQTIMIPNANSNTTAMSDVVAEDENKRNSKDEEERSEKTEKNRESLEGE